MKKLFVFPALAIAAVLAVSAIGPTTQSAFADGTCTAVQTQTKGTLTAAYVASTNETVTGDVDAHGCDIGVYVGVDVNQVTVSGMVHDANQYGVFNEGNVKVTSSQIYDIGNHNAGSFAPNGGQTGLGVYFWDASGSVSGSSVHDYQKGGIVISGASTAIVSDNQIVGLSSVPFIAQNGIQFGYGATGEVMRNSVDGNWYTGANWNSTGILVFESDNVVVQSNSISNSQTGIAVETWCYYGVASASNNKIVNNTIVDSDWGITVTAYDLFSECDAVANNNSVTNNTITTNSVNPDADGIFLGAVPAGNYNPTAENNKVIHNEISGFPPGQEVVQDGDSTSKVHANVLAP